MSDLTEPGKLLLLASVLARGGVISQNGKSWLKELILRRDARLTRLLEAFDDEGSQDVKFLDTINKLIGAPTEPPTPLFRALTVTGRIWSIARPPLPFAFAYSLPATTFHPPQRTRLRRSSMSSLRSAHWSVESLFPSPRGPRRASTARRWVGNENRCLTFSLR